MNEESKSCRSAERFYTAALLSTSPDPFETIEMQMVSPSADSSANHRMGAWHVHPCPKSLPKSVHVSHVASHAGHVETTNSFMLKASNRHKLSNEKKDAEFTEVIKYACCLHRPEEEHPRFQMQIPAPVAEFSHKYV